MKIKFLWIGTSKNKSFINIQNEYFKRLKHYAKVEVVSLKEPKLRSSAIANTKKVEGELIIDSLQKSDFVVLLDEKGKQFTSVKFADYLQHKMNTSTSRLVFVIAGAFGASEALKARASETISFSKMTLTHDMIRMLLVEQVYRGFTILRGEKYHNE